MKLPLTSLARKINQDKPQLLVKVADMMMKKASRKGLKGTKVAILGLSFRTDVADTRNSPSYKVVDLLSKRGISAIRAFDPYVTKDEKLEAKGVHLATNADDAAREADLIPLLTDHSVFKNQLGPDELLRKAATPAVLIDGRNLLASDRDPKTSDSTMHEKKEGFNIFIKSRKVTSI